MAIGLEQFTPETFAQANPFLTGFNASQQAFQNAQLAYQDAIKSQYAQPMAQQALTQAQYNNQILAPKAQYAPQMTQQALAQAIANVRNTNAGTTDIYQGKIPLEQAQATQARAMPGLFAAESAAQYANAHLANVHANLAPYATAASLGAVPSLVAGMQFVNTQFPQAGAARAPMPAGGAPMGGSPQANLPSAGFPYRMPLGAPNPIAPQNGAQAPLPQIGAGMPQAQSAQGVVPSMGYPATQMGLPQMNVQGLNVPNLFAMQLHNVLTGMGKNPAFGSSKGGEGGTFYNPMTGQSVSTDTSKNTTSDQAAIAAVGRVQPLINTIVKTLPQFQGASGQSTLYKDKFLNYLGANYATPSQYQLGTSAINEAAESMVKAFGVNPTDQNMAMMAGVLAPQKGESPSGYKQRLNEQLQQLYSNINQSRARLSGGIPLAPTAAPSLAATNAPSSRVLVVSPRGVKGYIPQNQLNQALQKGYQVTKS